MQAEYKLTLSSLTEANADTIAADRMRAAQAGFGFVPNMYGVMANSPGLLDTYVHGYERFRALSGFTPAEQEVVLLAISRENGCTYCVAAHSFIADKMSGVPEAVTNAIRDGQPIPDAKLSALHEFTRTMVVKRGLPDSADVNAFGRRVQRTADPRDRAGDRSENAEQLCQPPVSYPGRCHVCRARVGGLINRRSRAYAHDTAGRARKQPHF